MSKSRTSNRNYSISLLKALSVSAGLFLLVLAIGLDIVPAKGALYTHLSHSISTEAEDNSFFEHIAKHKEAVVQVQMIKRNKAHFNARQLEDFFLPENYRKDYSELAGNGRIGSGFIIDEAGYIVTARHLLKSADEVHVILQDGSRYIAQVIGEDLRTEIAVLKIDAINLPFIALNKGVNLKAGQLVFAIGSPMDKAFHNSVSMGIVSATFRVEEEEEMDHPAIEAGVTMSDLKPSYWITDAVINPGNSGGPMISSQGELLGMALVKDAPQPGHDGLAPVVFVDDVAKATEQLLEKGQPSQVRLGIQYGPVSEVRSGAVKIINVEPGSSASEAGLKQGDIILAINGSQLQNQFALSKEIEQKAPGDVITLTIKRGEDAISMQIRLKAAAKQRTVPTSMESYENTMLHRWGFVVDNLTQSLIYDLEVPVNQGVAIVFIDPESRAYREGDMRGGMVVVEVAGQPVHDVAMFDKAMQSQPANEPVLLKLYHPRSMEPVLTAMYKMGGE